MASKMNPLTLLSLFVAALVAMAGDALADKPVPWQMDFQEAASPVMERIIDFHNLLLIICVVIVLFVLGLLVYIAVKFNAKANPVPSKTTHNTLLEVVWTALPILILVVIAVPSFKLLYYMDRTQNAEMTLKVIGHQWYWSYEYPDNGNFTFDSNLVPTEELKKGQPRLLAVDNEIVLPIKTNIRLLTTSEDVIHNWAVPAYGVKLESVPGRTNEAWVNIDRVGTYYGQCSELCGVNHGYMPIVVKAVSKEEFKAWVIKAKKEFAAIEAPINQKKKNEQLVLADTNTR